MQDLIDSLIADVIVREGGDRYTDDGDDAGGPTKYGVTLAALQDWRRRPTTAADVQALTLTEATAIYRARYFPAGYEAIPDRGVLGLLFDYGVNSGPGAAVRALQTVLKRLGKYDGAIDGGFGPKSQAALRSVQNWPALFYALKCERYEAWMRYIGKQPSQAKYATGWSNRADQFEEQFS